MEHVAPPDDSGSDTFSRYRYQAHVALPFCLSCALGDRFDAVVPEHYEDVAVLDSGRWRYLQVKTKGDGLHRWSMSDVLAADGGVRSLFRSFRALGDSAESLELILEGSLKPRDAIHSLRRAETRDEAIASPLVHEAMERHFDDCDQAECDRFVSRLSVRPNTRNRMSIKDSNFRLVCDQAPRGRVEDADRVLDGFISIIETAMAAERVDLWPSVLLNGEERRHADAQFAAKWLDRASFAHLAGSLTMDVRPLLQSATSEAEPPGAMVEKLMMGGASEKVVEDAKKYRSAAAYRELEIMSGGGVSPGVEDDIQMRLTGVAHLARLKSDRADFPADAMWVDLFEKMLGNPAHYDPQGVFSQDPYLLMGEICQLSDRCLTDWGCNA